MYQMDNLGTNMPPVNTFGTPAPTTFAPIPPANFGAAFDQSARKINIEPNNLSGRQLIGKTAIGLVVGLLIATLLFVTLSFIGTMFQGAMQGGANFKANPLLRIIVLFIGFLSSFIGNMIVAGAYSVFFSKKYYDSGKMFAFLLLTNALLFIVLAPIYIVFAKDINTLFLILGFHVMFSIFISANQMEFLANPNYSGSALMGNVLGIAVAFLFYSIMYKSAKVSSVSNQTYFFMLFPSILAFTLLPLFSGLREKIYYKFYEMGAKAFYIPSLSEVTTDDITEQSKAEQEAEINVNF